MSNEELVAMIQRGNNEYINALWQQINRYVFWSAERYLTEYPDEIKALKHDCVHNGYFAMLDAIKGYNRSYGLFITHLRPYLRKAFREVCFSGRGDRKENDPLNGAASLDIEIDVDGEAAASLNEIICDKEPGAQTCFVISKDIERLEDADKWQTVNRFLNRCISDNSDMAGMEILKFMLDHNCKYSEAVKTLYGNEAVYDNRLRGQKNAAEKRLKQYMIKNHDDVKKLDIEDIAHSNMKKYCYGAYKERIFTSAVEDMVIKRYDRDIN